MPTLSLLDQTKMQGQHYSQLIRDALDLDGYKEVELFLDAQNVSFGTSSTKLTVRVMEAVRNGSNDYHTLETHDFTSSSNKLAYHAQFARFLRVEAEFDQDESGNSGDITVLVVPKK